MLILSLFQVLNLLLLFSCVQLFVTPWIAALQASLSFTISWSLLRFMSIESVMTFNHLILCCPLLLQSSIFPSIRVFSNESVLCIRWPKYWSFNFSISPSKKYSGLISFGIDWFGLPFTGSLDSTWQVGFAAPHGCHGDPTYTIGSEAAGAHLAFCKG